MDHSARPANQVSRGTAAADPQLVVTIVAGPERSILRANRPEVLRVKASRSPVPGAAKLLAGWPKPDSWTTTNWGATISTITRLLADDLSLDPNVEYPTVQLHGIHLHPQDHEHPEPGIELLFDPRPVAYLEVVVDRVTPNAETFLWLFSTLRAAIALSALETEAAA